MEYLFDNWEKVRDACKGRCLLLLLDYDGTLTPIVARPEKAILSASTAILLNKLKVKPCLKLAIVSGRAIEDVKRKVGINGIIYVGNHGFEIEGPKIKFKSPLSGRYRSALDKIKGQLHKKLASVKGVILEDKGFSLSLHFRQVSKKQVSFVKTIFHETIIVPLVKERLRIKLGKMFLEIRPPIDWDKGKVVLWLLSRERFNLKDKKIVPIYLGDDTTDEDAFRELRNIGLTIFVGKPKESTAQYYLRNTVEVRLFLRRIAELENV